MKIFAASTFLILTAVCTEGFLLKKMMKGMMTAEHMHNSMSRPCCNIPMMPVMTDIPMMNDMPMMPDMSTMEMLSMMNSMSNSMDMMNSMKSKAREMASQKMKMHLKQMDKKSPCPHEQSHQSESSKPPCKHEMMRPTMVIMTKPQPVMMPVPAPVMTMPMHNSHIMSHSMPLMPNNPMANQGMMHSSFPHNTLASGNA